ncbi:MAG TPA: glucose 1-dehydrogenase [Kofleriaceae bacterium]
MKDKVAVVTGGSSGIGLATAKAFQQEGASVIIVGRDQKGLDDAAAQIGGEAFAVRADISKTTDLDALYAQVREKFTRIDVLFANAGIPGASVPMEKMTVEEFDAVFATNVKGTYFTVQRALPLLGKGASIILTTSIANQMARANVSAYAASKAAVRSLTQSFAAELLAKGIRVNAISPGGTDTGIIARRFSPEQVKVVMERIQTNLPMRRLAQPEEIANVAVFLASDESSMVLGEELVADGGASRFTTAF